MENLIQFSFRRNGTKKITATSPDNVGQWALNNAYWWHGRVSLYPGQTKYIQTSKAIFLEVHFLKRSN